MTDQALDPQRFREVLGHYPTGVTVITGVDADGAPAAMVVGTFTSVSLDPPLVAFLPTKSSSSFARLRGASSFAVNVLASDQEALCRRLARSDPDKLNRESWTYSELGHPVIDGVLAVVECDVVSVEEAGDHYIVLGAVRELQTRRQADPLLFFRGGYGGFTANSLIAVPGKGIEKALAAVQPLRDSLQELSLELGGEVAAFTLVDGDVVAVASAAPDEEARVTGLGTRYPHVPPIGVPFVAWAGEEHQEAWVDRAIGASDEEREAFRGYLADAREVGWSCTVNPPDQQVDFTPEPDADAHRRTRAIVSAAQYQLARDIEPDGQYNVAAVMAPIFDRSGAVPLLLRYMAVPPHPVSGERIRAIGTALTDYAARVGSEIIR